MTSIPNALADSSPMEFRLCPDKTNATQRELVLMGLSLLWTAWPELFDLDCGDLDCGEEDF